MILDGININNMINKYRDKKIIILGHDHSDVDSIVSGYLLEKCLLKEGYNASFYITDKSLNRETNDILNQYGFNIKEYQRDYKASNENKFFLVDHNERKLKGEIIGIIDHHPISKEILIECYFNKPISSTSLYICKENEDVFDKKDMQLAIIATMLDTCSFNSTKGREEDKKWVINKCNELGLDYDKLYKSGLYYTPLVNLKESSVNGLKKYNYNGKLVESSYVHIDSYDTNINQINEMIDMLKEYRNNKGLDMFVFIVHDMGVLKTRVYKISDDGVSEVMYERYTSRGNDIMPSVEKELSEYKR